MDDPETEFLSGLIELQYGQDVVDKLTLIASQVPWAVGWPSNKKSFWNAEAFMWGRKIGKEKRRLIEKELSFLRGRNLDLGCGAYSYIKSVGFDLSAKMLDFNDNLIEKVQGDLERKLPFPDSSFDSITAIFVLNYVENYSLLLSEVRKVLKQEGVFVVVLFSEEINEWQKQKEVNDFNADRWSGILREAGFKVDFCEKEGLWFFRCSCGILRD